MQNYNFSFGETKQTQVKKPIPLSSDSARYILSNTPSSGQEEVLKMLVKSHILTLDFMRDYHGMLDAETVSSSPYLPYEIKEVYPDLFSYDVWASNKMRSVSFVLNDPEVYSCHSTAALVLRDVSDKEISKYANDLLDKFANTDNKELRDLLLKRIKNLDLERVLKYFPSVPASLLDNYYIQEEVRGKTDLLEKLIKSTTEITSRFILKSFLLTNDNGWKKRILSEIEDGTIELQNLNLNINEDLETVIDLLPDDMVPAILRMVEKSGAYFNYRVLQNILIYKELEEDDLISIADIFMKNGGTTALMRYAKDHDFDGLATVIAFGSL